MNRFQDDKYYVANVVEDLFAEVEADSFESAGQKALSLWNTDLSEKVSCELTFDGLAPLVAARVSARVSERLSKASEVSDKVHVLSGLDVSKRLSFTICPQSSSDS